MPKSDNAQYSVKNNDRNWKQASVGIPDFYILSYWHKCAEH